MSNLLLALDFGGSKHTLGVVGRGEGKWRAHQRVLSPPDADVDYDIRTVVRVARELLVGARPAAVGVSFGGPVDFETGTVRLSHHVPGWEGVPLQSRLQTEFDAPVRVDNDANAAALGEHCFGAGQRCDSLLYVTVSTGVGGGWILNGKPWRGADGMAGEIGHTVVDPHGPPCLCGKRGCVERLASGPYMALDARERLRAEPGRGAVLRGLAAGGDLTAETVSEAAARGDGLAREILDRGAWALGVGLGNAANLLNPQRILLGGGVTKSGERWLRIVRETARSTALPQVSVDIRLAGLGDDAPLWGAVALAARSAA